MEVINGSAGVSELVCARGPESNASDTTTGFIQSAEVQLTKALLFTLIVFLIMYMPLYCYRSIFTFVQPAEVCSNGILIEMGVRIFFTLLHYFFHGALPFVYVFGNPKMRKELKDIFCTVWISVSSYCISVLC